MPIPQIRSQMAAAGLCLAALVAAITGCNRSAGPADPADPGAAFDPQEPSVEMGMPPGAKEMGEGRWLQGAELEAYRKAYPLDQPDRDPLPGSDLGAPAAKSAAYDPCIVNFNSVQGLNFMADKAYYVYATHPFYTQPCNLAYTTVRPLGKDSRGRDYNFYYLPTEESGTCTGTFGNMGYGTGLGESCPNQKAASLFPRYAGNGSVTDGNLGLRVAIPTNRPFDLVYFFARSGKVRVTVTFAAGGTKTYDNIAVAPGFFVFNDARRIVTADFYAADAKVFYIDNIYVQPR